jgi:hypothetical protein
MALRPRLLASTTSIERAARDVPVGGIVPNRHTPGPSPQLLSGAVCLVVFLALGLAMHGAVTISALRAQDAHSGTGPR